MTHLIQTFKGDRKGFSLVEYALIAGLVALISVIILSSMGSSLTGLFGRVDTRLSSA